MAKPANNLLTRGRTAEQSPEMVDEGKGGRQGHPPVSVPPIHPQHAPSKGGRHRHLAQLQSEAWCGMESGLQAMPCCCWWYASGPVACRAQATCTVACTLGLLDSPPASFLDTAVHFHTKPL